MSQIKLSAFIVISSLLSFTSYSAENPPAQAPSQTASAAVSANNTAQQGEKLSETLKATKIEIEIREKIMKDMAERQKSLNAQNELQKNESLANKSKSTLHKVLMYVPNRMIDLSEIFTIGAGAGPEAVTEFAMTKYFQFGGAYGDRYFIEKGYNRQFGGGYSSGYSLPLICWNKEQLLVDYTFGTVNPYVILNDERMSIQSYRDAAYRDGYDDFWKVGAKAGWLFDFECYFHPVAMANFFTGFAFIRLTDTQDL